MEIIAGENFIWVFELKNNDNSALALASLSSAKVEIFNNDVKRLTYVYPSENLRANSVLTQLELEVPEGDTAGFRQGSVSLKITLKKDNSNYQIEDEVDIIMVEEMTIA